MRSLRTLAAAALVAATAITSPAGATLPSEVVGEATVVSLDVRHAGGRAELSVGVSAEVRIQDFVLRQPDRIVLDLTGATLGLPTGASYDRTSRGAIVNVRYSQYRSDVVRVVVTLAEPRDYKVVQGDGAVRLSIDGDAGEFSAWTVGTAPERSLAQVDIPQDATAVAPPEKTSLPVSDREVPVRPVALTAEQQSQQRRITISFDNTPISDFVATFAAFSGRTILPSRGVTGVISGTVVDQPWDVAMRALLNANGFDATEDANGILIIDTFAQIQQRQAAQPMITRTVRLNYSRSSAVAPMVAQRLSRDCGRGAPPSFGSSTAVPPGTTGVVADPVAEQQQGGMVQSLACPQRGAVSADTLTNSLSITDIPSAIVGLEEYARSMDIRQPQVNIKAKIILVDRTSLEGLGLRYDLGTRNQFFNDIVPRLDSLGKPRTDAGQIALGGNTLSAIANATQRVPGAALQLVYSTAMGAFDFTTFFEALQQTSLLDVQAEPSATVLNNRTANLTAGTEVPVRVVEAGAGANAQGNFPRATVQFRQTGVILNVTPQITNNGYVQMRVHVENSDVQLVSSDVGALFPKQSVDNEILVADGETAVMGGLTQTRVNITKTGIPFLVDLPIIGRLFGTTTRDETKRDLLILITPHILDEGLPPGTGRN